MVTYLSEGLLTVVFESFGQDVDVVGVGHVGECIGSLGGYELLDLQRGGLLGRLRERLDRNQHGRQRV